MHNAEMPESPLPISASLSGTGSWWPSVAQVGDSSVIAAQGPDNSLLFYWQPIGSQQWNPEQVAGPGTTASAPSVAQVGNSTVIAAAAPDGSLQFYWQPIGSEQWNPEQVASQRQGNTEDQLPQRHVRAQAQ